VKSYFQKAFVCFVLCASFALPCFAAITATTQWELRTTGADSNGGGFDTASTGTDRSQQDTAYIAYTDLVIGATTTQATSAAHPFDATSPGNVVNVISGTGCTVQRTQVVSVAGTTATFDVALGTAASTCTGNLGGALLTLNTAINAVAPDNVINIKAGTYTQTATATQVANNNFSLIGFGTAHGDNGTRPLLTTATNSVDILRANAGLAVINVNFSSTAATKGGAIVDTHSGAAGVVMNCTFDGFGFATIDSSNGSSGNAASVIWAQLYVSGVEIKNGNIGIYQFDELYVTDSYIHAMTGDGIVERGNAANSIAIISRTIVNGASHGISTQYVGSYVRLSSVTIANSTSDGILFNNTTNLSQINLVVENSVIYGNGGYGVNWTGGTPTAFTNYSWRNNGFGSNTSGDVNTGNRGFSYIALTATPFTNSATGDFSLNATAGGGALLKGAGFPGIFPGGTSTGSLDVGAVQSAGSGGAAGMLVNGGMTGGVR